jgi:hypothetical protein
MRNISGKNNAISADNSTPSVKTEECYLLTLSDIARHLKVSIAQLQKLRRAGRILRPTVTLGRSPRFLDKSFYAWLNAGCPPAIYWDGKGKSL